MDDENDIVEKLGTLNAQLIIERLEGIDIRSDHDCLRDAISEIKRLREENRQLRERSTEAVIAWINETIKRAGEAHILKKAQEGCNP